MENATVIKDRFTSADLEQMPNGFDRYEIIAGELYVSRQPKTEHQYTCNRLGHLLEQWNEVAGLGIVLPAPGLVFGEDDDVAPDVIWITRDRYEESLDAAGHLNRAPQLVIEVLSPGRANEFRDREAKLDLYSRRGVEEYWIVSFMQRFVEVYRREGGVLRLVSTLRDLDTLDSPLLPGFSCQVSSLFFR
jgi:Uma2 family endonuclease